MDKEKIIEILEDYEFFVDDDFGGHYEHIDCSQKAGIPLGILEILDYISNLEQQVKKQKEVIDKAIKLIKYQERYRDGAECYQFVDMVSEILDPLQSILEQDETTNNAYLKEFEDLLKEVSE